jgi:hypothetical protein
MKKLILIILLSPLSLFSQESIMDKVANATCEYLQSDEIKSLTNDKMSIKMGVFLISYYTEHKEEFVKEGFEFNLTDEKGGEELGYKIGMQMATICPETIMALAADDSDEDNIIKTFVVEGKLKTITGEDFSYIHIKDTQGKSQKFLWLGNFIGSDQLIESDNIKNLKVSVTYKNTECYSPKLKEYIIIKEIVEIEYL